MPPKTKRQKEVTKPGKASDKQVKVTSRKQTATPPPSSFLIHFDNKARIFLLLLVLLYVILSLSKIHTSSIANWEPFFGLSEESESVIFGKPRFIRMDEWMTSTPSIFGQYELGMPLSNEALGAGNVPVIFGFPVKDVSTILRPNMWSYFIFDLERAFAFSWNFPIFFFLIGAFLLLMLLTRNNFWLSVFGTFFLFLGGAVQWWSYAIAIYMMYLNGVIISFIYILYSKKRWQLILSGLILVLSIYGFIFNLYPPFQVILVWLYAFIFLGFILQRKNYKAIKENWLIKVLVLAGALLILGIFFYHYYTLVKDSYAIMLNTVYPGRRFSTGGDLIDGKIFSEFFGMYLSDEHTPDQWLNVCEASGFIMFFPILFYGMAYRYFKSRTFDPLQLSLAVFIIIGLVYVLFGFPAFLSKLTLFSMSPATRVLPIIGVANYFLLICYLGDRRTAQNEKFSWLEAGLVALATFIFMWAVTNNINKATANFFTSTQTIVVIILGTAAYVFIRYKDYRYVKPILMVLLLGMTISNITINPVTKGLSAILENPLLKTSKEVHKKDPQARWILFGDTRLTHLLRANGIKIFNGVKFLPRLADMKVIDPSGKSDSIFNRYAHINMTSYVWNDSTRVEMTKIGTKVINDNYNVWMDPCSPKLKQLNIKYFVFPYKPKEPEIRCLTVVAETFGIYIYKRNDQ